MKRRQESGREGMILTSAEVKNIQEQINFVLPHLTIHLYDVRLELDIPSSKEQDDHLFSAWTWGYKQYSLYLRQSEKCKRGKVEFYFRQPQPAKPSDKEEFMVNTDPDIVQFNSYIGNVDSYIRNSIIKLTHYFAKKALTTTTVFGEYFQQIVEGVIKECTDERILQETIRAARSVILSENANNLRMVKGSFSKIIIKIQEQLPSRYEAATNELLEFIYEYLERATKVKEDDKNLLNFTLLQLKGKDLKIRDKFFILANKYFGSTIYKKMQHIFLHQIWSRSKDNYWIQQALDLLLSTVNENLPMKREPGGLVLLSFSKTNFNGVDFAINKVAPEIHKQQPMQDVGTNDLVGHSMNDINLSKANKKAEIEKRSVELKEELKEMGLPEELIRIGVSVQLVKERLNKKKTKSWLRPLRKIIDWESQSCEKLWLRLFPQFWNALTADEQQQIASLIEPFLGRCEFLKQMQPKGPSSIRTIFEGVSLCNPLPRITPELIHYLATHYGSWHTSLLLLEAYFYAYPGNDRYTIYTSFILKHLSAGDYLIGIQRYAAKHSITKAILSYVQFQMWNAADNLLSKLIKRYSAIRTVIQNQRDDEAKEEVKGHISIEELKENPKEGGISGIGEEIEQLDVRIWEEWETESALNLGKWDLVKDIAEFTHRAPLMLQYFLSTRNWSAFLDYAASTGNSESSTTFLATLYDGIQKFLDDDQKMEEVRKKGLKILNYEWNFLPVNVDVSHYRSLILQQHFLEISELKEMYLNIRDVLQKPNVSLRLFLNAWRMRLPNKAEDFTVWRNLLECRNFMLMQLIRKLSTIPGFSKVKPYIDDIPWNYLKLAQVARKHGLLDQAIKYLSGADHELKNNQINNYERFLRASEFAKLALVLGYNIKETANYLKGVETQGYCVNYKSSLSEIKRLRSELLLRLNRKQDAYNELNSAVNVCESNYKAWRALGNYYELEFEAKHTTQFNALALRAYMYAAIYMLDKSRYYIPRVFQCLENEGIRQMTPLESEEAIKAFKEIYSKMPVWAWIYWIPQLFSNIDRSVSEREAATLILKNIASLYPQALYLPLRQIQEQANKNNEQLSSSIEDIKHKMQMKESQFNSIELIFNELENKVLFTANKEPELLLCLKYIYSLCAPLVNKEDLKIYFKQIIDDFFIDNDLEEYKEKFLADFSREVIDARDIKETLKRLRNWIDFFHTKISLKSDPSFINAYSPTLASLRPEYIEMFGVNYIKDSEPMPESIIYIQRTEVKLEKIFRQARVSFKGTNEKDYVYSLTMKNIGNITRFMKDSCVVNESAEILIIQLRGFISKVLATNRYTMARNIKLFTPSVFYWGRMKVSLEALHIMTAEDLHDASLIERGYHPDHAIISYLNKAAGLTNMARALEIQKEVIQDMRKILGDYIFAGLIHQVIQNPEELFIYKKQCTGYLASQSFFTYVFQICCRTLYSWNFCKRTGKIYYSHYDLPLKVNVPFRFAANMQYFITPIGAEGPLAGSITAIAYAMQLKLKYLERYLKIFYRDLWKAVCWGKSAEENSKKAISTLSELVDFNVIQRVASKRNENFDPMDEKEYNFNKKVYEIIDEARDQERLNLMPLEWAPWF